MASPRNRKEIAFYSMNKLLNRLRKIIGRICLEKTKKSASEMKSDLYEYIVIDFETDYPEKKNSISVYLETGGYRDPDTAGDLEAIYVLRFSDHKHKKSDENYEQEKSNEDKKMKTVFVQDKIFVRDRNDNEDYWKDLMKKRKKSEMDRLAKGGNGLQFVIRKDVATKVIKDGVNDVMSAVERFVAKHDPQK